MALFHLFTILTTFTILYSLWIKETTEIKTKTNDCFYPSVSTFRFGKNKNKTKKKSNTKKRIPTNMKTVYSAKQCTMYGAINWNSIHGCWNSEACEFDLAWNSVIYHSLECFGFTTPQSDCYSIQIETLLSILNLACVLLSYIFIYSMNWLKTFFVATFGQAIFHRSAS